MSTATATRITRTALPIHFVQPELRQMTFNAFCHVHGVYADRIRFHAYALNHGWHSNDTLGEERWEMLLTQFDSQDQANTQADALR